jgi:serine/threonine-protein kinase
VNEVDGTPFGRYRLLSLVGEGGMGEVWRAHDTVTDRVVAIKVLALNLSKDEEFQRRFRREAQAAARLETPHVVPIYDYGEIDGRLFVCMRLIKGRDLAAVLVGGPLEPARAVRIIGQVAEALHAAHGMGLIHRDIKPSNILLDDRDFAYLIDFGIARVADDTRLTQTGNTIGTFAYIAPERLDLKGQEDARVDIYSLACVLYECLTGQPPFASDAMPRLMMAHLHSPPPRPSIARSDVPAQIDEVIATGMAKDPDLRYATTVELADAARDAITVPIPRATPSPAPNPSSAPPQPTAAVPGNVIPPAPAPTLVDHTSAATGGSQPLVQPRRGDPAVHAGPSRTGGQDAAGVLVAGVGQPPQRRNRRPWIIAGVAAVVVLVAAIVGIPSISRHRTGETSPPSKTSQAIPTSAKSSPSQAVLPFTDLKGPWGVAVDSAGDVYVVDFFNKRVRKQAPNSSTARSLGFTLVGPTGIAVDAAGNVYVGDGWASQIVKLAAGSSTQVVLPFTGLSQPVGVAVDSAGNVYAADTNNGRVLKLAAGSSTQEVLPFADLTSPEGVAVDSTGDVYVADTPSGRVVKLPAGKPTQEVLPFTDLASPASVAVDSAGNVYVVDRQRNRVLTLAAGSTSQRVLPFTDIEDPRGVAVDAGGNVYVTDYGHDRVLKLAVR